MCVCVCVHHWDDVPAAFLHTSGWRLTPSKSGRALDLYVTTKSTKYKLTKENERNVKDAIEAENVKIITPWQLTTSDRMTVKKCTFSLILHPSVVAKILVGMREHLNCCFSSCGHLMLDLGGLAVHSCGRQTRHCAIWQSNSNGVWEKEKAKR